MSYSGEGLISIIVPVYNVEEYLDKCVESIVDQTYKNLEIILVDDGATDNSGKLCDEWAKKDDRIRVVHKENGGLSSARNAGLDIATGDYIGFVDSDDYISSVMYERLLKIINEHDADIACCGVIRYTNAEYIPTLINNLKEVTYDMDKLDFYTDCVTQRNTGGLGVCNKLYRRSAFVGMRFKEGIYVEDYYFLPELVERMNKAVMWSFPGYFYFLRNGGITRSFYATSEKHIHDRLLGCEHNIEILKDKSPEFKNLVNVANLPRYLVISRIAGLCGTSQYTKEIEQIRKTLRRNFFVLLRSEYVSKGVKKSYLAWFVCPPLYYRLYKHNEKKRK